MAAMAAVASMDWGPSVVDRWGQCARRPSAGENGGCPRCVWMSGGQVAAVAGSNRCSPKARKPSVGMAGQGPRSVWAWWSGHCPKWPKGAGTGRRPMGCQWTVSGPSMGRQRRPSVGGVDAGPAFVRAGFARAGFVRAGLYLACIPVILNNLTQICCYMIGSIAGRVTQ